MSSDQKATTYTEVLDVMKHLVVQGEVVAGDDVNAGILLDLPVSQSEALGLSEEVSLGDLIGPVFRLSLAHRLLFVFFFYRNGFRR